MAAVPCRCFGLVFTVTGVFEAVGAGAIGEASPRWFSWNPWRGWLIIQSLVLANAGYLAAIGTRRFGLVLAGIIVGLLVITPIGVLAVFPSLWLLRLVIRARSSFDLFSPRQPEFPWGPTFEEKIGERPALLIHVRMGAVPGEAAALFEAVQRALRAVDLRRGAIPRGTI